MNRAVAFLFRARSPLLHIAMFMSIAMSGATAHAYDQPVAWANVKLVESSYTPDAVVFQIDALVANCAAGAWLRWSGGALYPSGSDEAKRQANVRAVHATLLTALAAGKRVAVHAKNGTAQDPTCVVEFLHLRND